MITRTVSPQYFASVEWSCFCDLSIHGRVSLRQCSIIHITGLEHDCRSLYLSFMCCCCCRCSYCAHPQYRMSQLRATDKALRATLPSSASKRMVLFGDLNFRCHICSERRCVARCLSPHKQDGLLRYMSDKFILEKRSNLLTYDWSGWTNRLHVLLVLLKYQYTDVDRVDRKC